MNIRDPQKFQATFWDWTPFNDCFGGTRIRITDIDGAVERNGKFLFIETKLPGQDIPTGQRIFLTALHRPPVVRVLIVWGYPNQPVEAQVWHQPKVKADPARLHDFIQRWFAWADSQKGKRHDP